jgi:hypothetical protein
MRRASPESIDGDVVRLLKQEGALISHCLKASRPLREPYEYFLHRITRVHLTAGEIQEESIERRRMFVIEPCEIEGHRYFDKDAPRGRFCLSR